MRLNTLTLPLALVVLAVSSLTLMQPAFSLFGRAYGVTGDSLALRDEPAPVATLERRAAGDVAATGTPTTTATPEPSTATPSPTSTASATFTATAQPASPTATGTRTPQIASRTPTPEPTGTATPTPCVPLKLEIGFEGTEIPMPLPDGGAKILLRLRNAGPRDLDGAHLRLVFETGGTLVTEARFSETEAWRPAAAEQHDRKLPRLERGAVHEIVVVLMPSSTELKATSEAVLRAEVRGQDCEADRVALLAETRLKLQRAVRPVVVTPVLGEKPQPSVADVVAPVAPR